MIQVADTNDDMAYYIPHIYTTNDVGLIAGRETLGAPKKLATIDLSTDVGVRQGILERPAGKRLATITVKPDQQAPEDILSTLGDMLPSPLPYIGLRHLPAITGDDGLTQLVEFQADVDFHENVKGIPKVWAGPTSVSYDSESAVDPVNNLAVDEMIAGIYYEFDQTATLTGVQKKW